MNGNYPNYTSIILRYIALEYFRHSGQSFNYNSWRVCIYANQPDFPIQSNGHSCGPYVCMMAKAIVHNLHFTFNAQTARFTIASELINKSLHDVPVLDE